MREPALAASAAWRAADNAPMGGPARAEPWDLLLACVALYVATAVGRVHELFPALLPLKPAMLSAVLAVGLLLLQQAGARNVARLRSATTT